MGLSDTGFQEAPATPGDIPVASDATPLADSGAGDPGTSPKFSRDDHVHPASGGSGGGAALLAGMVSGSGIMVSGAVDTSIFTANPSLVEGPVKLAGGTAQAGDDLEYVLTGSLAQGAVGSLQPVIIARLGGAGFGPSYLNVPPGNYGIQVVGRFKVIAVGANGSVTGSFFTEFTDGATGVPIKQYTHQLSVSSIDFTTDKHVDFEIAPTDAAASVLVAFANITHTPKP